LKKEEEMITIRMWNVEPKEMCRQHLLGEHLEMHMFVGTFNQHKSLDGYIKNRLVELHNVEKRHRKLSIEMTRRGYKHKTPLSFYFNGRAGKVDSETNKKELSKRCKECRRLQNGKG
jgi:hypothetical protein